MPLLLAISAYFLSASIVLPPSEIPVPEPTHLGDVASAPGSKTTASQPIGEVDSADARAVFTLIEIETPEGEQASGIKVELASGDGQDETYITDDLLPSLLEELEHLDYVHQQGEPCEWPRCTRGIARCRPSQTIVQAYCLGIYRTADDQTGFLFSTPRRSFTFPDVQPLQFAAPFSDLLKQSE